MTLEQNIERFFWEVDAKILRLSRSEERYKRGIEHLQKLVNKRLESIGEGFQGVQLIMR